MGYPSNVLNRKKAEVDIPSGVTLKWQGTATEGFILCDKTTVDASAGGTAQTTNLTNVPASSLLLDVVAVVTTAFDGDTTQTLEVGVSGNVDAYIDSVDFDPSAAANTYAASHNGTTNDIKTAQWLASATQLVATWTNDSSAAAGEVDVYVIYCKV